MTNERASQSITVSAKTVAEAIAEAEQRLGLSGDEIDVTIISEGSKGFLGMGGENARILAMPKTVLSRRPPEAARPAPRSAPPAAPSMGLEPEIEQSPLVSRARKQAAARQESPDGARPAPAPAENVPALVDDEPDYEPVLDAVEPAGADASEVAALAIEVVREMLTRIGLDATATVRSTTNPAVIDIAGDDLGLLIGRHGETLASLQYLVNAIIRKRMNRWSRVVIDVEHYRMRREDTLRALAGRQASRVRQTHREIMLEPMPASERRVVHMTLQNSPWVVTNSVGEEPNRCVVISPRPAAR